MSYKYPAKERVNIVSTEDVLTIIDPRTSYGIVYAIPK